MKAEIFIARRYLFSKRKVNLITIITAISIIGVTIGVAAMIVVLSVFNGFNSKVTSILMGFDPHIRVEPAGSDRFADYSEVISKINDSRIKYIAPYTLNKAMIASRNNNTVLYIKGVDPSEIENVSGLKKSVRLGVFDLTDESEELAGMLIGVSAAYQMHVNVGDTITIISPSGLESSLTQFVEPVTRKCLIRGIFYAENKEYDSKYAYVSLSTAQGLFRMYNKVSGIEMRLDDIQNSDDVKETLKSQLGSSYNIQSWYDLHSDFYSILQVERWVAFIILSLIIAVATFNILASLTMTVIEKKRDIGVLKAMGTSEKSIVRIFMSEGIVVGLIGMFVGSALGAGLILAQKYFEIYKLDSSVYIVNALPVELRYTDFIFIPLAALLLCFLASLYPAIRAAKVDPVESIRWE